MKSPAQQHTELSSGWFGSGSETASIHGAPQYVHTFLNSDQCQHARLRELLRLLTVESDHGTVQRADHDMSDKGKTVYAEVLSRD